MNATAPPDILDIAEGHRGSAGDQGCGLSVLHAEYLSEAQSHGETAFYGRRLQGAIIAGSVDIDRPYLPPVFDCITDNLRRLVESHGLGVQKCGAEYVRMPALQPR